MKRADTVTVERLFSGSSRYRCAPGTPGFHWSPARIAQFIVDIENSALDTLDEEDVPEARLYLGVIGVRPGQSGATMLLDGAHRLALIAMYLAFARDRLPTGGERRKLQRRLVHRPFAGHAETRLRLSPQDHAWYSHFILPMDATHDLPATPPPASPRDLFVAAQFLQHTFESYSVHELRSNVDFLLHHTALVRSFAVDSGRETAASAAWTAPVSTPAPVRPALTYTAPPRPAPVVAAPAPVAVPPPRTMTPHPLWRHQDVSPPSSHSIAAE